VGKIMTVRVGDYYERTEGMFNGTVYIVISLKSKMYLVNMETGAFWSTQDKVEDDVLDGFKKVHVTMKTTPATLVCRINKEYQVLLQLATEGRYLANGADDQRLASQRDVYGAFYCVWKDLIYKIFPEDIARKVVDMDVELWDHANICDQIVNYCQTWLDDVEVKIEAS